MSAPRRTAAAAALLLVLVACSGREPGPADTGPAPISYDPTRPWAVTAIDYHFHDAHPTPRLDPDGALVFTNEGRNLHNVTIVGTDFSRDIRPGQEIRIEPIGSLLPGPGRFRLVCRYHADRGMTGTIVVGEG